MENSGTFTTSANPWQPSGSPQAALGQPPGYAATDTCSRSSMHGVDGTARSRLVSRDSLCDCLAAGQAAPVNLLCVSWTSTSRADHVVSPGKRQKRRSKNRRSRAGSGAMLRRRNWRLQLSDERDCCRDTAEAGGSAEAEAAGEVEHVAHARGLLGLPVIGGLALPDGITTLSIGRMARQPCLCVHAPVQPRPMCSLIHTARSRACPTWRHIPRRRGWDPDGNADTTGSAFQLARRCTSTVTKQTWL